MALEGSLKEFNVADILQLLFFQKKTGALILQGRHDKIRMLFSEGNIVGAESRRRGFDKRLIWILAKRGYLSQEQLDTAIEKARAEGGKFIHHLVKDGVFSKEDVQKIYSYLVNEIMSRVFLMKEGLYEFKPQGIPIDKEVGVVLNTEHYLMEGVRMVDEWSEIQDRITLDDVFVIDEEAQARLDADEQEIADYVDGVFDVADIADIVGKDSFTVASRLLSIEDKGAVYRMSTEDEYADAPKPKSRPKPIPFLQAMLAVISLAFFGVAIAQYVMSPRQMFGFDASEQLYGLRIEVQASHAQTGKYPRSMSAVDPWGNAVVYKASKDGFEIFSSGPDATPGTPDDIY